MTFISLKPMNKKNNFLQFRILFVNLVVLCLYKINADAQVASYNFAATSETYTPISGTAAFTSGYDDGNVTSVPIGFSFVYNGTSYTTCTINANGFISFGTTAPPSGTPYTPISGTTLYS